jgi:hypothetical protein
MTTNKTTYNKETLRLPKSYDYWWDILMGGLLTSIILISIGGLILMKLNLTFWFYPYSTLCLVLVAYYQWRDDNFTVIKTGLSKAKNYTLTTECLDNLDWEYDKKTTWVDLTLNKYILKFLSPTIIPESEKILINFKYHSTTKTGRLPFFFGISTYLKWTFTRTLKKTLLRTSNLNQIDNDK